MSSPHLFIGRRTRGKRSEPEQEEDDDGAPKCPVCFHPYGAEADHQQYCFPCGHAVCAGCDGRMRNRGFHTCPTCRTPREGVTRAEADLAAQSRVLTDQARDRAEELGVPPGLTPNVSGVVEHNGNQYEIMFFASEAEGDPFDVLRAVAPAARTSTLPTLARSRRFRIDDGDHPNFHRPVDALAEEEEVEEAHRSIAQQLRTGSTGPVQIGGPLGELVRELVQPGDLSTFLARHEVARRTATAENSRPASRGTRMLAAAERQLAATRRGGRSAVL
jgi:hypothetical protein